MGSDVKKALAAWTERQGKQSKRHMLTLDGWKDGKKVRVQLDLEETLEGQIFLRFSPTSYLELEPKAALKFARRLLMLYGNVTHIPDTRQLNLFEDNNEDDADGEVQCCK